LSWVHRDLRPSAAEAAVARAGRRRALGTVGEHLAAEHLRRRGCIELARNVRTRHGEIDLVVLDGQVLVFVEVKTRRISRRQSSIREDQEPLRGLGVPQRRRLRRLAAAWLRESSGRRPVCESIRFDAIGVVVDSAGIPRRVEHVKDAF
jgi:putative endonuclease